MSTAPIWLCAALLFVVGLSQQLVLCAPDGGNVHLDFLHDEGACCAHAAIAPAVDGQHPDAPADERDGGRSADSDPHCEHVDLAIDVGTGPSPDHADAPAASPVFVPPTATIPWLTSHQTTSPQPPATGPPRPRPWLAHHRTLVLLI